MSRDEHSLPQSAARALKYLVLAGGAFLMVFPFVWVWNDFLEPIIFLRDWDSYPISVGLAFFQGRYSVEWHLFMGATLVSILPILVIYFFAQRHLIGGLASIGIKG